MNVLSVPVRTKVALWLSTVLFICLGSYFFVHTASAESPDVIVAEGLPEVLKGTNLVLETVKERIDAQGAELALAESSNDPYIALLIELLEKLIAIYQQLLEQQDGEADADGAVKVEYIKARENILEDGTMEFYIVFGVTPAKGDIHISSTASEAVVFRVTDENGVSQNDDIRAYTLSSTADEYAGLNEVNGGETEEFTLAVDFNPDSEGSYRLFLDKLYYKNEAGQRFTLILGDEFRTQRVEWDGEENEEGTLQLSFEGKKMSPISNVSLRIAQAICGIADTSCAWDKTPIEPAPIYGKDGDPYLKFIKPAGGQNETVTIGNGLYAITVTDPLAKESTATDGKYRVYLQKYASDNSSTLENLYEANIKRIEESGGSIYLKWDFTVDGTTNKIPAGWYYIYAVNTETSVRGNVSAYTFLVNDVTAPTMTLSAKPISISAGESSIISWSSTNANYCSDGDKMDTSGSFTTDILSATKTYTVTCVGDGGSVTKSITVSVGETELHVVGVYEGSSDHGGCYSTRAPVSVRVRNTGKPIILALSAYEPVLWNISLDEGAQVKEIILGGYHSQNINDIPVNVSKQYTFLNGVGSQGVDTGSGVFIDARNPSGKIYHGTSCAENAAVPMDQRIYFKSGGEYYYAYAQGSTQYTKWASKLKTVTGLDVKSFQGKPSGTTFTVPSTVTADATVKQIEQGLPQVLRAAQMVLETVEEQITPNANVLGASTATEKQVQKLVDTLEETVRIYRNVLDEQKQVARAIVTKPVITVTSPNGGEQWEMGQMNTVTWTPYSYNPDVNPSYAVTAYLERKERKGYTTFGKVEESGKASIHWVTGELDSATKGGSFVEPGEGYYIRVVNNVTGASDRSDKPFTILPKSVDLKVNGSDGPVSVPAGTAMTVSWTSQGMDTCTIYGADQSPFGGEAQVVPVGENGTMTLYAPLANEGISVYCSDQVDGVIAKQVNDWVTIDNTHLQILNPNGSEIVKVGEPFDVKWSQSGIATLSIALYKNDKWYKWLQKDQISKEFSGYKDGFYHYTWVPSSADVSTADLNQSIYKIYITGQKLDGTDYLDDKSDATFIFSAPSLMSASPLTGVAPLGVTFNLSSGICTGNWFRIVYGDGIIEDLGGCSLIDTPNPTIPPHYHTYSAVGTYTAKLQALIGGTWYNQSSTTVTVSADKGIDVSLLGSTAKVTIGPDNLDDSATYTISLNVAAFGEDAYVSINPATSIRYSIRDSAGNLAIKGAQTAALTSTADQEDTTYFIAEGSTENFTLSVKYTPGVSNTIARLWLDSINYGFTSGSIGQSWTTSPKFRTSLVTMNASCTINCEF
jgi:hypothetical protein